jgi:hypothetical protein
VISFDQLLVELILLDVLPPSPTATGPGSEVYPQVSHGFAAYIIGGFVGLGLIVLTMVLLSIKPKRADPYHKGSPDPSDQP